MSKGNSNTIHRERESCLSANWALALIHRDAIPVLRGATRPSKLIGEQRCV